MQRSWKTTLGGALGVLAIFLKHSPSPSVAAWSDAVMAASVAWIGLCARDNNVTSEDVKAAKSKGTAGFFRFGLFMLCVCLMAGIVMFAGCARFNTRQTDISTTTDAYGITTTRTITTEATARTFLDARSQLANFKASQTDKSQGASVGSLTQESAGSNVNALVESVVGAAVKAAIK